MYVGVAQLDPDIDDGVQTIDWGAVFLAASDCCKDAVNSNHCLGNDAFLEHALCNMSIAVAEKVGEGCAAMTCNGGSGSVAGLVDDDGRYALADNDKGVIGDDTDMAGDETGEANDDASAAGDTGGASRVGSSSPSVMLMAARGLALMMAATPFLAASL